MKLKMLIAAGAVLAPLLFAPQGAQAAPYCREYTKKIMVGGRHESGYGQACLQPDGDWMITETRGTVDPFVEFYARNPNVILVSHEPVHFKHGRRNYYRPSYGRPLNYYPYAYPPRNSGLSFYLNFGDDDHHRHRHRNNAYSQWNRRDRDRDRDWDRHDGDRDWDRRR
ncbi:MAG: hypothetical protein ACT4OY_02355 [Alphaproteobacteria bacterium]